MFRALGRQVTPSRNLDTFPTPDGVTLVTLDCDEFTSLCPVTQQPDMARIIITFAPRVACLESKSLKLYLQTYRNEGMFCEALAAQIAADIDMALRPAWCEVEVQQKRRGGIAITARARKEQDYA